MIKKSQGGTIHNLPDDISGALATSSLALTNWNSLTPLARNEWICWVISVKSQKTRDQHIVRMISELEEGKRRPCCWYGCIHRTDKPMSKSQKYITNR